jgi:hypothetical protein
MDYASPPPIRALVLTALLAASASFAVDTKADSVTIRKLLADASGIGLPVGAATPAFKLKDQNGHEQDFASLSGRSGLVLVFFRSADW